MKDIMIIDGKEIQYFPNEDIFNDTYLYGYVYVTTDLTNGNLYVGQAQFIVDEDERYQKRDDEHVYTHQRWRHYYGSGRVIRERIKKYGKDKFHRVIIDVADSAEELRKLEQKYIRLFKANEKDNWYNMKMGPKVKTNFSKLMSIRWDENKPEDVEFVKRFNEHCADSEMSKNSIMQIALKQYLDNIEKP